MNEHEFTQRIRKALDESSARVPYRVSHRLEQARAAALARHAQTAPEPLAEPQELRSTVGAGVGSAPSFGIPLWWRIGLALLPALALTAGLLAISAWHEAETADELIELDAAVLMDEVPLNAYADRGFGVFLKNNRQ